MDIAGVGVGSYNAIITVAAVGASNTPQTASVSLDVAAAAAPVPGVGPPPAPPPPSAIEVTVGGETVTYSISEQGEVLQTIAVASVDGKLNINIPEGTIALDDGGNALASLGIVANEAPPPPPPAAGIVGMAYDVGPSGATFAPPVTFTLEYDPAALPEGTAEEGLVLAFYDEAAGEWVEVPSTVDVVANTITASVSHLTTFAVIAGTITPPTPAAFSVASLFIRPPEVGPGEAVSITVAVVNTGGTEGSYSVVLEINGVQEAEQSVTLAADSSQAVIFSVTREDVGSYAVNVDGLSASFAVAASAAFSVSSLSIEPLEVEPNEAVTVSVSVANTGGMEGSYSVVLEINGVPEAEQSVTLAAGSSDVVSFSVTRGETDSYSVAIDGLSGSFAVAAPAAFSVASLSIEPLEVEPNEAVTVGVSVANTGGSAGSYSVVLEINGVPEAEQSVTLAAGSSDVANFSVTREDEGSYTVSVDGLSDSFAVAEPSSTTPFSLPLIAGIVAAVVAGALSILFLARRRQMLRW